MSRYNPRWRHLPPVLLTLALAGCATAPAPPAAAFDPAIAMAAIQAAGAADERELQITPLTDPQVEDLRDQAAHLQAQGRHADAATALDHALQITPDDPALLQERAEVALWQKDLALAERLARRALAMGARVGPLCRRHWETIAQVLTATAAPMAAVAEARQARDGCTAAAPDRF